MDAYSSINAYSIANDNYTYTDWHTHFDANGHTFGHFHFSPDGPAHWHFDAKRQRHAYVGADIHPHPDADAKPPTDDD